MYLEEALVEELSTRVSNILMQGVLALGLVQNETEREPAERGEVLCLGSGRWGSRSLEYIKEAQKLAQVHRVVAIAGEPGSGKSELLVLAAVRAVEQGCHVLILCPTGALVHSYRDRLRDMEKITVDTAQASFCIVRKADVEWVRYAPRF